MPDNKKSLAERLKCECKKVIVPVKLGKIWFLVGFPIMGELFAAGQKWPSNWFSPKQATAGAIGLGLGALGSWWVEGTDQRRQRDRLAGVAAKRTEREMLIKGYDLYSQIQRAKGQDPEVGGYLDSLP